MGKTSEHTVTLRSKVAVCGAATTGKSSLISMFKSKGSESRKEYKMTTGVEVVPVPVNLDAVKTRVELFLLDAPGHQLHTEADAAKACGTLSQVMLVYDVSNPASFDACQSWLEAVRKLRPAHQQEALMQGVLVANKVDLPTQRHLVDSDTAAAWAASQNLEFLQCSAAAPGKDYAQPFRRLAEQFRSHYEARVQRMATVCQ